MGKIERISPIKYVDFQAFQEVDASKSCTKDLNIEKAENIYLP
jgi:hypothetical protein